MERVLRVRLLVCVAACLIPFCAQADEPQVELEKIVVTPYKTNVSLEQSAASVDVVSVSSALSEGKVTVTDALKDLPSVNYATSGGIGGDTSLFIRGANPEHTQVLLDGIKLYDPIVTSGYFYGYNYMDIDGLDRIEVCKGPFSTLYGSGSIGGTVNLLTKKGIGRPKFSYTQEFGSYDTFRERLSSDGSFGKTAYSFSLSRNDINSFYSARYKAGNHERDPYHNFSGLGRLDYAFTDSFDISTVMDYTYAKYEYDGSSWFPPYEPIDANNNYAYFYQGIVGITARHKVTDDFLQKFTVGYTRTKRIGSEEDSGDFWYDGKTYQAKWEGDYTLVPWDAVLFGFDYLKETGQGFGWSTREPKKDAHTKGGYLQNNMSFADTVFLSASYRIEDHSAYHINNTYSLSGSYRIHPTGTTLKASYGKGFKAPSLYQLYSSYGNPGLNPEVSKSYEAGFEQKLFNALFGLTYFHTDLSNLIDFDNTSWKYFNGGKSRLYGIESSMAIPLYRDATMKFGYTYLNARKNSDKSRLLRRPEHKVFCNFEARFWKRLEFTPEFSYIGDRIDSSNKLKAYILFNLSAKYKINENLKAFLRFENILNYDYQLISGYQTPGFSSYVGFTLDF